MKNPLLLRCVPYIAVLAGALSVRAQIVSLVVTNGAGSPDGIGTFQSFSGGPVLNDSGDVAFRAFVSGNVTGVFRGNASTGSLIRVARDGQPAPVADSFFSAFAFPPQINTATQVVFVNNLEGAVDATNSFGIFGYGITSNNVLSEIVRIGSAPPEGNGWLEVISESPALNSNGRVTFRARLVGTSQGSTDYEGIYLADGTNLAKIVRTGELWPSPDNLRFTSFRYPVNPVVNDVDQVVFLAELYGDSGSFAWLVMRADGEDIVSLAAGGQAVPEGDGQLSGSFSQPTLNDIGQAAFRDTLYLTQGQTNNSGIYRCDENSLATLAREGQLLPGGSNRFGYLKPIQNGDVGVPLNNAGQVVFAAPLSGPAVDSTNDSAVFRADGIPVNLRQIAREGQPAPGSSLLFGSFDPGNEFALNEAGQVVFQAFLGDLWKSLYFYDDCLGLLKVVQIGDVMLGSTVTGFEFAFSHSLGNEGDGLNNRGEVVFSFILQNDMRGIAIWKPFELRITNISIQGNDVLLTWKTFGNTTNTVMAASTLTGPYSDVSGPILIPGSGKATTNFLHFGGVTNATRFYRIRSP